MGWSLKNFVTNPAGAGFIGNPLLGSDDDSGTGIFDMIPGIGDARAQDKANRLNLAEAARNREFQERMSSTAYQRGMKDMRAAGLNPMLAFMQGGASTPSGSQAVVGPSSKTRLADMALQTVTGISRMNSQASAVQSQQDVGKSTINLNTTTAAKNLADAERTAVETELKRNEIPGSKAKSSVWDVINKGIKEFKSTATQVKKSHDRIIERGEKSRKIEKDRKAEEYLKGLRNQRLKERLPPGNWRLKH